MNNPDRHQNDKNFSSVANRRQRLNALYLCISENIHTFAEALKKDLGKSEFESYSTETGFVLQEISLMKRKLKKWSSPRKVNTNQMINFWSRSWIQAEPYGKVLIISPWNYPLNLSIAPMAAAIAAGNSVVLKPSEYSFHTSNVLEKLIPEYFPDKSIQVYTGGPEVSQSLLQENWDFIFFTGSPAVGKIVMKAAAEQMTPVCLELGGKSPVYIDRSANIQLAAKRIIYGKLLNSGQTCIAPDHVYIDQAVKNEFIEALKLQSEKFWGKNPADHPDYPKIINHTKHQRLIDMLKDTNAICLGSETEKKGKINPHIIPDCPEDHMLMQEEIFGPVLPVIGVKDHREAIRLIQNRPKPLALYLFMHNRNLQSEFLKSVSSGGVCINDTIMHISNPKLPFGGVGNSGIGAYHGKAGFETFSHMKSVLKKSKLADPALRYPPYSLKKLKLAKKVLK